MRENVLHLKMLGALMLTFLLCDADSMCPDVLILEPTEVIGQYNESVPVNCSTENANYDELFWRHGNINKTEDESNFISSEVSLSDWNMTAECRIKLNESTECGKDLKITIYKNPVMVNVFPTTYVKYMVEGTPYELQCDVLEVAPVQNLMVTWYKDNQTVKTDTFNSTIKHAQDVSSNLIVIATRGENNAQIRCEAQLDMGPNGPQLPVFSKTHHVPPAHYAPELKNQTDIDFRVNEGDNVTLDCEAEGNPPPVFRWTSSGVNVYEDTSELNIIRVNDTATYTCKATNDLGNVTKLFHVDVTKATIVAAAPAALPAMTTPGASTQRECPIMLTPAEIVVRFGDRASINCTTSATDAFGMGWEAPVGGTGFINASTVTWTVDNLQDWNIIPQCYVTAGIQCYKEANVTLYKTPDLMSVTVLNDVGYMEEGKEYQLRCDITSVAPVGKLKVKWYRDNETVHTEVFNGPDVTPCNVSSEWSVIPRRDHNGSLFRCEAELDLGPKGPEFAPNATSSPYTAIVRYTPRFQDCESRYSGLEHNISMDKVPCRVDGNPQPSVEWFYQGNLINASEPLTRNQSGKYTAKVKNDLGTSNFSVDITVEYGPSFSCIDHYEVKEGGKFHNCKPDGNPLPTITWFKDGKTIVTPQSWKKHDTGDYILRADNNHGSANHMLSIAVLFAPVLKEGNHMKEVAPGANVTLECSAEGNPPPEIRWMYPSAGNAWNTTEGRQTNVIVRGATSTNGGVYICAATNKVGTVTRSVVLMVKEKKLWWPWIIVVIVLVIIIAAVVRCCRKKKGLYSLVHAKDTSESQYQMTPQSKVVKA